MGRRRPRAEPPPRRLPDQDRLELKTESEAIHRDLAAVCQARLPPDREAAMDAAGRHRGHIIRWFYRCTYEIHRGLGELYVSDPRFTATYEGLASGASRSGEWSLSGRPGPPDT